MGYSITKEHADKLERFRSEDRLCQGAARCSSRATYGALTQQGQEGEQPGEVSTLVMCKKHLDEMLGIVAHYGYHTQNHRDRPLSVVKMSRTAHGTEVRQNLFAAAKEERLISDDTPIYAYEIAFR